MFIADEMNEKCMRETTGLNAVIKVLCSTDLFSVIWDYAYAVATECANSPHTL